MSRLKFRIWDKQENKWYEPVFEAYQGNLHEIVITLNGDLCARKLNSFEHESLWPDRYEIVQFTGLHDKNGVEIYEGDIVEFTYWWFDGNPAEASLTGAIEYLPESMSFAMAGIKNADWLKHVGGDVDTTPFAFFRFEGDDFRVIGNIHQNPELIP